MERCQYRYRFNPMALSKIKLKTNMEVKAFLTPHVHGASKSILTTERTERTAGGTERLPVYSR